MECKPARMKKNEQAVQDFIPCRDDFDADPFDENAPALWSLQSGIIESPKVLEDC